MPEPQTMYLPPLEEEKWPGIFKAARLDVVPDPMVMRVADLFVGGKAFTVDAELNPDEVWEAISENLDALIAFFHILMTRDKIPLIDYEKTFNITNLKALGDIAPPRKTYDE